MHSTTELNFFQTRTIDGETPETGPSNLVAHYDAILNQARLNWTTHHRLTRLLGKGGQGVVYLTERRGADGFTLPVALKMFSPEHYEDSTQYDLAMARIARVAAKVAQIQQDNLLDVHNFIDRDHIRMMMMEWVDGYDLRQLLVPKMLHQLEDRMSRKRWEYINDVVVTAGPVQPRLMPGVAVAICRDCLAALAALHREGIVHGDIKPSNIMVKKLGNVKIVDIGSAFQLDDLPPHRTCTPTYAAPELLEGNASTPRSDLASLGYVLVELLAGRPLFSGRLSVRQLLEGKRALSMQLDELLPEEVTNSALLMSFLRGLVSPDPNLRFPTADDADLDELGAAAFHRQLVKGDLASEYNNEIRIWLESVADLESDVEPPTTAEK